MTTSSLSKKRHFLAKNLPKLFFFNRNIGRSTTLKNRQTFEQEPVCRQTMQNHRSATMTRVGFGKFRSQPKFSFFQKI
jgi:hypothetical protein